MPNDKHHLQISRHHCLLDINPPDIRIRDFGSLNGTYVNGKKIGQRERRQSPEEGAALRFPEYDLGDEDRIQLGPTVLQVSVFTPAICAECHREIPEEQRSAALVGPNLYQCEACRLVAMAAGRKAPEVRSRSCQQCGRCVKDEIGPNRHGLYICLACRANPMQVLLDLLERAKSGRPELRAIQGYTIEKELGRGGMGAVYLARRDGTREHVALKVMLPQVAADKDATQKFLREAENTRALRHPHIVEARDVGCSEGTFFFTLEFCNTGTVHDLFTHRGRPLDIDAAVKLILQVLDALDYAHHAVIPNVRLKNGGYKPGRGLVHRDLKPQNVMLHAVGGKITAKVGDFGLGKAFDLAGLSGQTRSGTAAGTPQFMPRQQVRRFKYAQPDVDVWAAAATLYYLLTGHFVRDFRQDGGKDIWQQVLECDALPIRKRNRAIPARLAEVIDTALREEPKIGFSRAADLKRALEQAR